MLYPTLAQLWSFRLMEGIPFYAGVLFPAGLSFVALVACWREVRLYRWGIFGSFLANVPYVVYQTYPAPWREGLFLIGAFTVVVLYISRQPNRRMSPMVAFCGMWLSLVPADLLGAYIQFYRYYPQDQYSSLYPLFWLGAKGWTDGLFVYPVGVYILAIIAPPFYLKVRKHSLPLVGGNELS